MGCDKAAAFAGKKICKEILHLRLQLVLLRLFRSSVAFLILFQELNLAEAMVNRLQTVGLRFCGSADHALPRLRGALPSGSFIVKL